MTSSLWASQCFVVVDIIFVGVSFLYFFLWLTSSLWAFQCFVVELVPVSVSARFVVVDICVGVSVCFVCNVHC